MCVWLHLWGFLAGGRLEDKKNKNMTFRELLNRPAGDARRQAPQVEGNGCRVNYLEWDWGFAREGGRGGVHAWVEGLMPMTDPPWQAPWSFRWRTGLHTPYLLLPPLLFSLTFSWSAAGPASLRHCLSLPFCSQPVAPHVSVQPPASTSSCSTVTRTPFLIAHSD